LPQNVYLLELYEDGLFEKYKIYISCLLPSFTYSDSARSIKLEDSKVQAGTTVFFQWMGNYFSKLTHLFLYRTP